VNALLQRVLAEKRGIFLPLAVVLAVNVLVYLVVVRPLGIKSAGAADRAATAAMSLQSAENELARAQALVTGKAQADEELSAFYQKVLPADVTAARRMTYASLPALARKASVRYEARTTDVDDLKDDTRFGHMKIRMVLQGDYERLRGFIYDLETAPEFVIIDDVTLVETTSTETLTLTVNMSTYFRLKPNGR
jgi:hypothetical protein